MSTHAPAAELVLDARAEVGECPVWDAGRELLVWVDIYRGEVHLLDPASGRDRSIDVGQPVGAVAPTSQGWLVLAVRDGFARLDPGTEAVKPLARLTGEPDDSLMNDGRCDRAGRFLAGTTTIAETPEAGTLYRLGPHFEVEPVLRGVTLSNGLDWSPDGAKMYYVDSATQRIDAFDYDAGGALHNRRSFVQIPPEHGFPDGLTVDAEGAVWVALWGGGAVHCYSGEGRLEAVITLPVAQVASCAFGGRDLADLYITTARWGLAEDDDPAAGGVFVARPGVAGLAPTPFAAAA